MAVGPVQVNKFFELLKQWVRAWEIEFKPNNVWNMDETGISDVPDPLAADPDEEDNPDEEDEEDEDENEDDEADEYLRQFTNKGGEVN